MATNKIEGGPGSSQHGLDTLHLAGCLEPQIRGLMKLGLTLQEALRVVKAEYKIFAHLGDVATYCHRAVNGNPQTSDDDVFNSY